MPKVLWIERQKKRKRSDSVLWQKPLYHQKIEKSSDATKHFDYTTIADWLGTVSWSNDSHPTGVVKPYVCTRCCYMCKATHLKVVILEYKLEINQLESELIFLSYDICINQLSRWHPKLCLEGKFICIYLCQGFNTEIKLSYHNLEDNFKINSQNDILPWSWVTRATRALHRLRAEMTLIMLFDRIAENPKNASSGT